MPRGICSALVRAAFRLFGSGSRGRGEYPISAADADVKILCPNFCGRNDRIIAGRRLDLDSGLLNNGTNDDLKFWQDAQGTLLLTPQNGARMAVYNMQAPRQSECEEINLGADDMAVMQLEKGIYLCYRSDRGFLGYIRVETIDLEQVSVEYMTWSLP